MLGHSARPTALIYPATGRPGAVGKADIKFLALAGGIDILAVRDQSGRPIRPASPVVLAGRSRQLPLPGIVGQARHGRWDLVYPVDPLLAYAQGAADKLAGTIPGAMAYAGAVVGEAANSPASPGQVEIKQVITGSPADDAGLQDGGQIVEIAGQHITARADVLRIITQQRPYQITELVILRNHVQIVLKLTVGYRPAGT